MEPFHAPTRTPLSPARRAGWPAAFLLVLALGGCVKNFYNPFDRSGNSADSISLFVDNQNFNDVRLYSVSTRGRESVGFVTGRSTENFTVTWRQSGDIRFQIEVLAGRSYQTNSVAASPGDRLQLYIRDNPNNTYLTRR